MSTAAGVRETSPSEARVGRLVSISRFTRTLQRPEFGALMGAVAVFLIFRFLDATPNHLWLTQIGLAS